MSVNTQVRASKLFGRTVIVAAAAGVVGVAITLIVATMLLVGSIQAPAQVTIEQPAQWPLEPGYVDYGQRHSVTVEQPAQWPVEPGYEDFGQRHPALQLPLEPGYLDHGQRHPLPVQNAED
jgi:hypothetical protein